MSEHNQALTALEEAPPSSDPAPVEQPGADVAASSAESPDVTAESSPATGDKPATLEDAISAALGEKEPESQPEAPPAEEEAKSEESVEEPEGKKDEPPSEEKKDDLNLDALSKKAQTRFRELSKEVSELKATVSELRRYTGDEQGFDNFKELLRLHAEAPAQAVPLLEKILEDARVRGGLVVNSEDIRQKLDDGVIDEPTALELEQARRAREAAAAELKKQKQAEAERTQETQVLALNNWEKSVRERNPDYDSIAERVQDRFVALATKQYPRTTDETVALANQALADVTGWAKRIMPAKKPMKVAPSSGSSAKVSAKPQSIEDIVNRVLG